MINVKQKPAPLLTPISKIFKVWKGKLKSFSMIWNKSTQKPIKLIQSLQIKNIKFPCSEQTELLTLEFLETLKKSFIIHNYSLKSFSSIK